MLTQMVDTKGERPPGYGVNIYQYACLGRYWRLVPPHIETHF